MSEQRICDNRDIILTIGCEVSTDFINQIAKHIDEALGPLGFNRKVTNNLDGTVELVYYQFARAL